MESFHWTSTILSIILSLGLTRLLVSAVALFRSRGSAKMDWVPMVWAGSIFLWQIQFWWALHEIPLLVNKWTLLDFLCLIGLDLLLFVASVLVLPPDELRKGESLMNTFARDGRWSLLFLAAYFVMANMVDSFFWKASFISYLSLLNYSLAAMCLAYIALRRRWIKCFITLLYAALSLWTAWEQSPKEY